MSHMRTREPESGPGRSMLAVLLGLGITTLLLAMLPQPQPGGPGTDSKYIGAKKCKSCHRSEASGNQFGAWSESRHAKAWETLGSDAAREHGAARGIDNPQESDQCLKCHVTAFGVEKKRIKGKHDPKLGVQCESCHGPGSEHMAARFAAAAALGEGAAPAYVKVPEGEIIPNPPMKTCLECHNDESPSFKAFCFYERVGKVRHLNPKKPRTVEERAAMLVCGCADACGCVDGCRHDECGVAPKAAAGG